MSCDKLVFDLSQEIEGSPNVFVRKDWINILDNQNQNYQNNQSIIDTSQLSNSNKYMSYREAYLSVPLLLSVVAPETTTTYSIGDFAIGLKNWFGTVIHSLTLDYNGTTIIQQTPFCNMWNSFKLMTSLSWGDIITQGSTIGFYPDISDSWGFVGSGGSGNGLGVCNNDCGTSDCHVSVNSTAGQMINNNYSQFNQTANMGGNTGLTQRISAIAYDSSCGSSTTNGIGSQTYELRGVTKSNCNQIWKSYVLTRQGSATAQKAIFQITCMATIYLKHLHSFFNMVPLLKGVFMKLTLNLNNASVTTTYNATSDAFTAYQTSVPVGGVCPIMVPSASTGSAWALSANITGTSNTFYYNISVGARCTDSIITSLSNLNTLFKEGALSKSVYLYVPAYTFNPTFEQAYLSQSVKTIKYTDIYQYQVTTGIDSGMPFNNLITNGIANIKSVLIIPFYKKDAAGNDYLEYQSPFDPAGAGPTAPMVTLGNFNVQISGQNAIYNTQRYTFEQFNNQLYGQFAVNGGLTDGLTSGLVGFQDFQHTYCYYYVNVERMLPVEQSVPKSVQILGTNFSTETIQLWVFIEYGVEINVDVLTGARV